MSFFNLPESESAYGHLAKALGTGAGQGLSQSLQGWLEKRENIKKAQGLVPIFEQFGLSKEDTQHMINSGLSPQELIPIAGLVQKQRAAEQSQQSRVATGQSNRVEKGRPLVDKHLNTLLKSQGKAFDSAAHDRARQMALEIYDSDPSISPYDAALKAYENLTSPNQQGAARTQEDREGLGEDFLGASAKLARPAVGIASAIGKAGDFLGGLGTKAIQSLRGMTPEQIEAQNERAQALPKSALDTSNALQNFDELTGGRGIIGENVQGDILGNVNKAIQRVVGASTLGGLPMVAAQSGEEILKSAGFGEIAQFIGGLGGLAAAEKAGLKLGPIFEQLEKRIARVPTASKALNEASKAADIPKEDIIKEAAQNLEKRGVNVLKAVEGDPEALNQLQKEVNKVSDTFKTAERQNVKELQKVRQDVAKKLPESPLEKYYAPKKEVKSRPETIAKEAERIRPLESQIKQNERRLQNLQYQVLTSESALRAGDLVPEQIRQIESKLAHDRLTHEKTLNEIKNLNFEKKYGRRPMTTEDIQKQIGETFEKLREGIKNPSAEKVEAFRKGIERDREAIATAEKLAARGEIPGKPVFDEFIKIHQEYNKSYADLSKELGDFIKDKKGNKRLAKQVANATELKNLVDEAKKIGEAKVVNQIDKRRAMREIDKPASGAFYRQMLKDLRKDVDAFQRDFFKWRNIQKEFPGLSPGHVSEDIKVSKAAKKAGGEIFGENPTGKPLGKEGEPSKAKAEKVAEDAAKAAKNPSEENIKKTANGANASADEVKDFLGKMKEKWKGFEEKSKKSTVTDKDISTFSSRIAHELPKFKGALKSALIIGSIQGFMEEFTGFKPSSALTGGIAALITPGTIKSKGAAFGLTTYVAKLIRDGFEYLEAEKLKSLRNTLQFNERVKELQAKHPSAKVNRIVKKATS